MREVIDIKPFRMRVDEIFLCAAALLAMMYALIFPQPASASASRALSLCGGRVVPSLCVFMISAKMLVASGISRVFSAAKAPKRRGGVSGGGLTALAVGLISGYPMGAAAAAELCAENKMSREEAGTLLPFINNAGPAFLVGAVGVGMFGDARAGVVLLISQTAASALLLMLGVRRRAPAENEFYQKELPTRSVSGIIVSSIAGGGATLVSVCAFVVFFTVVSDAVAAFLAFCGIDNEFIIAAVRGFFEITSGLCDIGRLYGEYPLAAMAAGGAVTGFSGISVMLQVFDRAETGKINACGYFRGKAIMSAATSLFSVMLYLVFCAENIKTSVISAVCFVVAFIIPLFAEKLSKKCGKMKMYDV